MALRATKGGKPIPWALLKNVGVSPKALVSQMLSNEGSLLEISKASSSLMSRLSREGGRRFDRRLLRLIETNLASFDGSWAPSIQDELRLAKWQSSTRAREFSYDDSLAALIERWSAHPELMEGDATLCQSDC